jgi:hypothetical protein
LVKCSYKYAIYAKAPPFGVIFEVKNMEFPTGIMLILGSKICKFPTYLWWSFPGPQPVSIEVPSPYSVAPIPLLPRRLFIFEYLHTRGFDLSDNMEGTSIWKFGYEIGGRIAKRSGVNGIQASMEKMQRTLCSPYYLPEGLIASLPIHTSPYQIIPFTY